MSVNYSLKLISGYNVITLPATIQNLKSIKTRQNAWQMAERIIAGREWQTHGCRNLISAPLDRVN